LPRPVTIFAEEANEESRCSDDRPYFVARFSCVWGTLGNMAQRHRSEEQRTASAVPRAPIVSAKAGSKSANDRAGTAKLGGETVRRRVIVIVFDGVQTLDVAGPVEVFARANRLARRDLYTVIVASVHGGLVATSGGFKLTTRRLSALRPHPRDTAIVAGGDTIRSAVIDGQIGRWMLDAARIAERVGSVCSGAFVLAAAGLLDGRRATTHWSACEILASFRPQVTVDPKAIFVVQDRVWTSAGVTTGIDMVLAMVEADHGHRLADSLAAHLVLYLRRPGFESQWSPALTAQTESSDPLGSTLAWARRHLDRRLDVDTLAEHAGVSARTLHRRCVEHLGLTPARIIAKLRVEHAQTLLATSKLSGKEIARRCGLRDAAQLTRLVRRAAGVNARDYRAQSRSSGGMRLVERARA
jgi:transcriptional regulator GlxA family with amidase domain